MGMPLRVPMHGKPADNREDRNMTDELNNLLDALELYTEHDIDAELAEFYRPEQGVNQ